MQTAVEDLDEEKGSWEEEMASYLRSNPLVVLAFLFGSRGRGKARDGSDVDVAVYLRPPYTPRDVATIWSRLEDITRTGVDLVVLNDAPPGISWSAMTGKVLVNKDPRLGLEEMLRVSREAEDFREFVLGLWELRRRWRREGDR